MDEGKPVSGESITKSHRTITAKRNNVTVKITDTLGLIQGRESYTLKKLYKHVQKHAGGNTDILIYCLPVDPASKFEPNACIMQALQEAFGRDIWKQTLVVFTFSNVAWDRFKKKSKKKTNAEVVSEYKEHLEVYGKLFEDQLKKMMVQHNVVVNVGNEFEPAQQDVILAVPAGDDPEDEVLIHTGNEMVDFTSTAAIADHVVTFEARDWRDVVFIEMVKKRNDASKKVLLQYHYSRQETDTIVTTILGGALVGYIWGNATYERRAAPVATTLLAGAGAITGGIVGGLWAYLIIELEDELD
jgi:hypothetical protein